MVQNDSEQAKHSLVVSEEQQKTLNTNLEVRAGSFSRFVPYLGEAVKTFIEPWSSHSNDPRGLDFCRSLESGLFLPI